MIILVDAGANIDMLKRQGRRKSSTVVESHINESLANKMQVTNLMLQTTPLKSTM